MSMASKCDLCGNLFSDSSGCVSLDVNVISKEKYKGHDVCDSWRDIGFCSDCSVKILRLIGKALNDLPQEFIE